MGRRYRNVPMTPAMTPAREPEEELPVLLEARAAEPDVVVADGDEESAVPEAAVSE